MLTDNSIQLAQLFNLLSGTYSLEITMAEQSADTAASATGSEQISLTCSAEYMSYPLSEQTCWSVTSLKAPFYETTTRASVDIVAVIDKSGSMSGEKIKLVRKTLLFVIDQCEFIAS